MKKLLFFALCGTALLLVASPAFQSTPDTAVMNSYKDMDKTLPPEAPVSRKWMLYAMRLIKYERDPNPPRVARFYSYVATVFADVFEKTKSTAQASLATAEIIDTYYPKYRDKTESFLTELKPDVQILTPESTEILATYQNRMKTDGFDLPWDETVPDGENIWYRRGHLVDSPKAGDWTPWILDRSDTFSLPAPPPVGSLAYAYEQERIIQATRGRTDSDLDNIYIWNGGPAFRKIENNNNVTPAGIWQNVLYKEKADGLDEETYAKTQKILAQSIADSFIQCWRIKFAHWYPRPSQIVPGLRLTVADPEFPAYPSGHSCSGQSAAEVLSFLFPEKKDTWQTISFSTRAARLVGGVHWEIDTRMGAYLGQQVGSAILTRLYPDSFEKPTLKTPYIHPIALALRYADIKAHNWLTAQKERITKQTPQQIEKTLTLQIQHHPDSDTSYINLADYYRSTSRYKDAETVLLQAVQKNPHSVEAYYLLGNQYRHDQSEWDKAESILTEGIQKNPDTIEIQALYDQLGQLYRSQKKYREAENMFQQAITLNPHSYGLYGRNSFVFQLAQMYIDLRRYEEAERLMRTILENDPSPEIFIAIGQLYKKQILLNPAQEIFQQGLRTYPKSRPLYNALIKLYNERGQDQQATEMQKLRDTNTGNVIPFSNLPEEFKELNN
jgi:tetratricopeptide (TPR) repeat protein